MPISLESFKKLFENMPADFDGYFGTQCMDLMHFYVFLCLGIEDKSVLSASTAILAFTNKYPKYFKKIDNSPDNFPVKGDIVFWKATKTNSTGHVAIILSADAMKFTSLDANYPTGSMPHVVEHNYDNVAGWLHPIVEIENIETLKVQIKSLQNTIGTNKTPLSYYELKDLIKEIFTRLGVK